MSDINEFEFETITVQFKRPIKTNDREAGRASKHLRRTINWSLQSMGKDPEITAINFEPIVKSLDEQTKSYGVEMVPYF